MSLIERKSSIGNLDTAEKKSIGFEESRHENSQTRQGSQTTTIKSPKRDTEANMRSTIN